MSLLDNYGVGTAGFLYGIIEVTGLMWIYGFDKLSVDIHFMLKQRVGIVWKAIWVVITPCILIVS